MTVQQHVLNWLYSVLTSEYHDVTRTYNDVAQALSQYPSLSPRTDVHTFPNGVSALLLHLSGTIAVPFRGTTYRFPISLWVPHAYPREAPLVYVTPTENMVVRPGQHVDPQGQVYHPYLVGWATFWDKSTILDFLAILRDVFAKEPPVIAKQQSRPPSVGQPPFQQQATATPPPVPPLPTDMTRPASISHSQSQTPMPMPTPEGARPPPPPPKSNEQPPPQEPSPVPAAAPNQTTPPPLPPHPPHVGRPLSHYGQPGQFSPVEAPTPPPQSNRYSRYDSAPPLPRQGDRAAASQPLPGHFQPSGGPPQPPWTQYQHPPLGQTQFQTYPLPDSHLAPSFSPPPPPHTPQEQQQQQQYMQPQTTGGGWQQHQQPQTQQQLQQHNAATSTPPPPPPRPQQQQQQPPADHRRSPPPILNILPDQQSTPAQPSPPFASNPQPQPQAAPPPPPPAKPPNPERPLMLQRLAQALHAMRRRAVQQNTSSLEGLGAQRAAMLAALSSLQREQSSLAHLSSLLLSNAGILRDALGRADDVMRERGVGSSGGGGDAPPGVDELLVAPTVVANQLYDLVAEERALADAVFVLGRAVERGRVTPQVFAKTTRSLAREWFLKKALVRKVARGMGLVTQ